MYVYIHIYKTYSSFRLVIFSLVYNIRSYINNLRLVYVVKHMVLTKVDLHSF